jgi:hypothetical protein
MEKFPAGAFSSCKTDYNPDHVSYKPAVTTPVETAAVSPIEQLYVAITHRENLCHKFLWRWVP